MKKSDGSTVVQLARGTLRRVLKVPDLFGIGFGDLGSSIYYALGVTALFALGATPIALGLAGIVFICTALTYAEMGSIFPEAGGSASYSRHAFNDLISFLAGWALLLDYIVTIAISAFTVTTYLTFLLPNAELHSSYPGFHIVFSVGLLVLLFILNFIGVRQSTRLSLYLVLAVILSQVVVVVIGLESFFDLSYILDHLRIGVSGVDWSPTWGEFWKGVAMAMVAYIGIESIAQLGAEAQQPKRSIPRSIMITLVVLLVMYAGISLTALSAVPAHVLGTTYLTNPIEGIVAHLPFGQQILGALVGIVAAAILTAASNSGLVGASRLAFHLGEYYQLPRSLFRLHSKFRTPYVALAVFTGIACAIILASAADLTFIADLYNFGAMLAFTSAHLALIVIRIKQPNRPRPFRAPLNIPFGKFSLPLTAIIGGLSCFAVFILVVITKPAGRYLGVVWMLLGLVTYLLYRRRQRLSATAQIKLETVKVPHYKPLAVKKILVPTRGGTQTETVQMACELAKIHGASLLAVHIIEVPHAVPLDAPLLQRIALAEAVLKRTEAIAREIDVPIELQVVRARSVLDAILDLVKEEKIDLLVVGSLRRAANKSGKDGIGRLAEELARRTPSRIWICGSRSP